MTHHQGMYVYTIEIPIRWSDMDAFGHVNNSVFFTYFEQARIEWWKKQNLPDFSIGDTGPVIVSASCVYRKPIIYSDSISIKVFIGTLGKTSYETFYEICSKDNSSILYAEGATKIVWVDRKSGRPAPLPNYIIDLFSK